MDKNTHERLMSVLEKSRDMARTGLKPDIYEDEETWLRHKLDFIAGQLTYGMELLAALEAAEARAAFQEAKCNAAYEAVAEQAARADIAEARAGRLEATLLSYLEPGRG